MKILVINAGSTTLKYQLIDSESESVLAKGLCERIFLDGQIKFDHPNTGEKILIKEDMPDHGTALKIVIRELLDPEHGSLKSLDEIDAVGHRVVHGGETFSSSVKITEEVLKQIEAVSDLAPLHNPANLIGIRACQELMPGVPQTAVFDTAFHQTMPEKAYLYAIPYSYYKNYKIRRYGFHGTSHAYVSKRCAEIMGKSYDSAKIIVCHLGNGASVSAVCNGKCVDTSMGLTPLEGLVMGTRAGDIDTAVVEFIAHKENKSIDEIMNILNKKSGMLGLSDGLSSDSRDIEEGCKEGNENAKRTMEALTYRVAKYIGAYVAAMNGVDAICFTAGIGENSSTVRKMIVETYLGYLGITLDEEANKKRGEDTLISTTDSKVKVYVIPTNEELAIARETVELLK